MSTGQNYLEGTNAPNHFEPSVTVTVDDFVNQHIDLIGQNIDPESLYEQLTDSLRKQGIQHTGIAYNSILDGLRLFRSVMPPVDEVTDYHAAVMIRDGYIVELALITWEDGSDGDYLTPQKLNNRQLLNRIIDSEATSVLMVSSCCAYLADFAPVDNTCIDELSEALECFDIELVDWVIMNGDRNLSNQQARGWDYNQDGISPDEVYTVGVKH